MIYEANFSDIPRMVEVLKIMHSKSHFVGTGCEIDERLAKGLLLASIQNSTTGKGFARVSKKDDKIEGFLVGALMPVYQIGTKLQATDVFWVATDDVIPSEPVQLMREFVKWASVQSNVIQIYCAATSTVQSPEKTAKIFNRLGFEPYGGMHRILL